MNSKLYAINIKDFINGLLVSAFTGASTIIVTALSAAVNTGVLEINWQTVKYAAILSGMGYLMHKFGVDDQGKFLGKI